MKIDFAKEDLSKLQDFLSVPRRITLLGHVSPDGDAVGSTLGFASLLRTMGHSATVVYPTDAATNPGAAPPNAPCVKPCTSRGSPTPSSWRTSMRDPDIWTALSCIGCVALFTLATFLLLTGAPA